MKILHICMSDSGGAGKAALRTHTALLAAGIESHFLCCMSSSGAKNIATLPLPAPTLLQRVACKVGIDLSSSLRQARLTARYPHQFEILTFPDSGFDLAKHPLVKSADVIHLHWVAGFVDYPSFFRQVKKPIVWTLHDMNPFLGLFHYQGDTERNRRRFGALDQKCRTRKAAILKNIPHLHLICPSQWIQFESEKSLAFHGRKHSFIPNTIDPDPFKPTDRLLARQALNLPLDKQILLFVSDSISVYRKGFDLLANAIQHIGSSPSLVLCTIGSHPPPFELPLPTFHFGRVDSESMMSLLYSAADAFIIPSREDNLPNVMLESLACGTPVLGTPVGGIGETITPQNGILAHAVSVEAIGEAISEFLGRMDSFHRTMICESARTKFNPHTHARALMNVYTEIVHSLHE